MATHHLLEPALRESASLFSSFSLSSAIATPPPLGAAGVLPFLPGDVVFWKGDQPPVLLFCGAHPASSIFLG